MPEGDSLYRFAAMLRPVLSGKPILAARAHGPGPVPQVSRIVGATCTSVEAVGKNLLIAFDNGMVLRGHLRMYGAWRVYRPGEPWRRSEHQARLVLDVEGATVVNFSAPVIELLEQRALGHFRPVAALGPNLLDDDFDVDEAVRRFREPGRTALTLGDAIMDQQAMAGVGNIWKHETLFRCQLNPWLTVAELDDAELRGMVEMARDLLRASVGKDSTGHMRRPKQYVYSRAGQPCQRCRSRLQSTRQGQDLRYTTWCPSCQPVREGQRTLPPQPVRRRALH